MILRKWYITMQGNRLAEWLKNAAQMPQYVESFKANAITVCPSLYTVFFLVATLVIGNSAIKGTSFLTE